MRSVNNVDAFFVHICMLGPSTKSHSNRIYNNLYTIIHSTAFFFFFLAQNVARLCYWTHNSTSRNLPYVPYSLKKALEKFRGLSNSTIKQPAKQHLQFNTPTHSVFFSYIKPHKLYKLYKLGSYRQCHTLESLSFLLRMLGLEMHFKFGLLES